MQSSRRWTERQWGIYDLFLSFCRYHKIDEGKDFEEACDALWMHNNDEPAIRLIGQVNVCDRNVPAGMIGLLTTFERIYRDISP